MPVDKQYSAEEVRSIVDRMVRTLAMLYHFMGAEVCEQFGTDGEAAIRRAVHKYGEARGRKIREDVCARGLPLTLENLSKFYDLPLPLAWVSENVRVETNCVEQKVTYCPFAEEWKRLGGEKLGLIYCEQDLHMRKAYNEQLELQQFTNVLQGDPHCHSVLELKTK
jgi:hypothetical protein